MFARTTERIRHELKFRIAEVQSTERLTPNMIRIRVASPDFAGFRSAAYDDHVKLFFPPERGELALPTPGPNGLVFPEGSKRPEARDYTPRAFDGETNTLTLDFVLHGEGPAASWAERAKPGDRLGVGGPRGSFVVHGPFDWYLLAGDETALPAIGRRIEELPGDAHIIAFIEIADARERQSFRTKARLDLTWLERNGAAPGTTSLLFDAIRAASLPERVGYCFIAGEGGMSAGSRKYLIEERGQNSDFIKAAGYWRLGEADFDDGHAH